MPNVYFVGCSGSGKTTLASYVESRYGLPRLPSAARQVLSEYGLKEDQFAELFKDANRHEEYQMKVAERQISLEAQYEKQGPFVADRAFDNLAFTALYGTSLHKILHSQEIGDYLANLELGGHVIFLVRPTTDAWVAAKQQGERAEYLIWEDMHRFDGMLQFVLEAYNITYHPISTPCLRERRRLIDAVLRPLLKQPGVGSRKNPRPQFMGLYHTIDSQGRPVQYGPEWVVSQMKEWMVIKGVGPEVLNDLSVLPPDCPLVALRLRMEAVSDVVARMRYEVQANLQQLQTLSGLSSKLETITREEFMNIIEQSRHHVDEPEETADGK